MTGVRPSQVKWRILPRALATTDRVRDEVGKDLYRANVTSLREVLCSYFSGDCGGKGTSIVPLGGTPLGGKTFKVRWALPGRGKSGGLRLAVVAYCNEMKVVVAGAWVRKDDPSNGEVEDALADL